MNSSNSLEQVTGDAPKIEWNDWDAEHHRRRTWSVVDIGVANPNWGAIYELGVNTVYETGRTTFTLQQHVKLPKGEEVDAEYMKQQGLSVEDTQSETPIYPSEALREWYKHLVDVRLVTHNVPKIIKHLRIAKEAARDNGYEGWWVSLHDWIDIKCLFIHEYFGMGAIRLKRYCREPEFAPSDKPNRVYEDVSSIASVMQRYIDTRHDGDCHAAFAYYDEVIRPKLDELRSST